MLSLPFDLMRFWNVAFSGFRKVWEKDFKVWSVRSFTDVRGSLRQLTG